MRAPASSQQEAKRHNTAALPIVDSYFRRELDAAGAISQLSDKGVVGRYWMGEVSLQEAAVTNTGWRLDQAERYFRDVVTAAPINKPSAFTSQATRASIRRAQMPLYHPLIAKQRMPQPRTVEEVYGKLVKRSGSIKDLANAHEAPGPKILMTKQVIETAGLISELAVLLLSMRHATRNDCTDAWLPVQSLPLEDMGVAGETGSRSQWDMTIWQPGETVPEIAYKVQVKSSNGAYEYTPDNYSPDITMLHVSPDLQIAGVPQRYLGAVIISECLLESQQPKVAAQRVTANLDLRTEQLLTKLDQ